MTSTPRIDIPTTVASDAPPTEAARPTPEDVDDHRFEGSGVAAGVVVLLIVAALVVAVVAQNTETVPFELLWWSADVSLAVLVLVTALAVTAVDLVVGLVWRRRRRRVRRLTM